MLCCLFVCCALTIKNVGEYCHHRGENTKSKHIHYHYVAILLTCFETDVISSLALYRRECGNRACKICSYLRRRKARKSSWIKPPSPRGNQCGTIISNSMQLCQRWCIPIAWPRYVHASKGYFISTQMLSLCVTEQYLDGESEI